MWRQYQDAMIEPPEDDLPLIPPHPDCEPLLHLTNHARNPVAVVRVADVPLAVQRRWIRMFNTEPYALYALVDKAAPVCVESMADLNALLADQKGYRLAVLNTRKLPASVTPEKFLRWSQSRPLATDTTLYILRAMYGERWMPATTPLDTCQQ